MSHPNRADVLVLSLTPYRFATRARKAAFHLARSHRVVFASLAAAGRTGIRDSPGRSTVDGIAITQVPVGRIRQSTDLFSRIWNLLVVYLPAYVRLAGVVRRAPSRFVYVTSPSLARLGLRHAERFGSKLIFDVPERPGAVAVKGSLASSFARIERRRLSEVARYAALATVAVAPDSAVLEDLGFDRVVLLRNAPLDTWRADFRPPEAGDDRPLRGVLVGSLFEGRGVEAIIDALAICRTDGTPVRVTIAGPARPAYLADLERRAAQAGIADMIDWVGAVSSDDVSDLYLRHDVGFVLYDQSVSGNDGLSNKILECVASGRPVLAGDLPENRKFVEAHDVGWLSEVEARSLAGVLASIWERRELLVDYAERCRALGERELTWEKEMTPVLGLIDETGSRSDGALRGFPVKRLLSGAAKLGAGVAFGQLLVVLVSPLLSRLFSPEEFGVYALVVAISAVVTVVSTGRLELAVPVARSDRRARDALLLGMLYLLVGTFFTTVVVIVATLLGQRGVPIGPELLLVPAFAFFAGLFELASAYLVRRRRYAAAARRSVLLNGTMAASQLGLGAAGWPAGLSIGHVISRIVGAWYALHVGGIRLRRDLRGLQKSGVRRVARRTSHFPIVLAPSALVNAIGAQAPVLLFGLLLGPAAAGLLGFTQRVLGAPVALLGQSLAQVYTAESASSLRSSARDARVLFLRSSAILLSTAVVLGAAIFVLSPLLFGPIFGEEWVEGGHIAQALSIGVAAQMVAVPLSQTLIVFGRYRTQLMWDVGRLVVVAGAVIIPSGLGQRLAEIAWTFSVTSAVSYAVLWALCFDAVSRADRLDRTLSAVE